MKYGEIDVQINEHDHQKWQIGWYDTETKIYSNTLQAVI